MRAIVCKNALGFIGRAGRLMWHSKAELQHFARLTKGGTLIAGYNTFLHLPLLKGRQLVLDTHPIPHPEIDSIDWCIGGAKTYLKYAHLFTELHISTIIDDWQIGDVLMPELALPEGCKVFHYQFKINP